MPPKNPNDLLSTMFTNAISEPTLFRISDTENVDYEGQGAFGVFAEIVKFADMPDHEGRCLEQVVSDLAKAASANAGWASGVTEGTFFFDDLTSAERAVALIKLHIEKMCADANRHEPSSSSIPIWHL